MTFTNIDALLVLGMMVFGATLWLFAKGGPTPARIRKDDERRPRRR